MKAKVRSKEYIEKWLENNDFTLEYGDWKKNKCTFCNSMFVNCGKEIDVQKYTSSDKIYDYDGYWAWLKEWLILDENEDNIKIIGDGTTFGTKVIENGKKLINVIGVKIITDLDGTTVDITRRYRGNVQVELGVED